MKYYGLVDIDNLSYGFVEEDDNRITNKFIEITDEYHQQLLNEQSEGLEIVSDNKTVFTAKPNLYFVNTQGLWEKVDEEVFNIQQADKKRAELVESTYNIKAQRAYGGVIINDGFIFETNQGAITNTVATLSLMDDTSVTNWKFYTFNGEPYMAKLTKSELHYIAQFGRNMIDTCFEVEGIYNQNIKEFTVQQLNDTNFTNAFIDEVQTAMNKVSNKLDITFTLEN